MAFLHVLTETMSLSEIMLEVLSAEPRTLKHSDGSISERIEVRAKLASADEPAIQSIQTALDARHWEHLGYLPENFSKDKFNEKVQDGVIDLRKRPTVKLSDDDGKLYWLNTTRNGVVTAVSYIPKAA